MVTDAEWKYLLDCLNGNRIYSLDEKFKRPVKSAFERGFTVIIPEGTNSTFNKS